MATANTVFPFEAAGNGTDSGSNPMVTIPAEASTAFQKGDVVIIDGTSKDADVDNTPTGGAIFGIVSDSATGFTSPATINRDGNRADGDIVNVWLAAAMARFQGNIVPAATGDYTGVYATSLRADMAIVEETATGDGFAALDEGGTGVAYTLEYVSPQYDTVNSVWSYGREAGVGLLNPRVVFTFHNDATVFGS